MTPLNHVTKSREHEKLRELLLRHFEEQRRKRAIEACSETKAKMDELENELSNIVGLKELKVQLRKWAKGMLLDERRKALGLKVGIRRPPHMAFLGNPGTGMRWCFTAPPPYFMPSFACSNTSTKAESILHSSGVNCLLSASLYTSAFNICSFLSFSLF